jgi:hypothetical protein
VGKAADFGMGALLEPLSSIFGDHTGSADRDMLKFVCAPSPMALEDIKVFILEVTGIPDLLLHKLLP